MRLGKNIIASVSNSLWSALLSLAVVPVYIKLLGMESFGLIGFFATLQSMLLILDLGLAPTINREVARCYAKGQLNKAAKLLSTLSVLYWCAAIVILLLIFFLAPLIATYWLSPRELDKESLVSALSLMGVVIAVRSPIGLYQGALTGAQRLSMSSYLNIVMISFANLGAIAFLYFVSPTIEAFFLWQGLVATLHVIILHRLAWHVIGAKPKRRFDIEEIRRVWGFVASVGLAAGTGLLFSQLDKVIISKTMSLDSFGEYAVAKIVVGALYIAVIPVFQAVYARMSMLVAADDEEPVRQLYYTGTYILAAVIFPLAFTLVFFSEPLVGLWTQDAALAKAIAPVVALLALGTTLHGIMHFPYALQLAYARSDIALKANLVLMVVTVPVTATLAFRYGLMGGATAWLVLQSLYLLLGTMWTHQALLKGQGLHWLTHSALVPFLLTLGIFLVGRMMSYYLITNVYLTVVWVSLLNILAMSLLLLVPANVRNTLMTMLPSQPNR